MVNRYLGMGTKIYKTAQTANKIVKYLYQNYKKIKLWWVVAKKLTHLLHVVVINVSYLLDKQKCFLFLILDV